MNARVKLTATAHAYDPDLSACSVLLNGTSIGVVAQTRVDCSRMSGRVRVNNKQTTRWTYENLQGRGSLCSYGSRKEAVDALVTSFR